MYDADVSLTLISKSQHRKQSRLPRARYQREGQKAQPGMWLGENKIEDFRFCHGLSGTHGQAG